MASSALQLLGFVLSLGGLGATIAATFMVTWKRLESNTSVRQTYQGLWMTCSGFNNRETSCELHESLFDLPIEVQVTRAVMLFSIFLASVGVLVSTVGMKCTRFLDGNDKTKNAVAMAGGIMFMLSGVLTLAITSWYVRKIVQTFYGAHHKNRLPDEFGNAVFTSWAGAVLMLTGGVFLSCRRCSHSRPLVNLPNLRPKFQPTPNSSTDYV